VRLLVLCCEGSCCCIDVGVFVWRSWKAYAQEQKVALRDGLDKPKPPSNPLAALLRGGPKALQDFLHVSE
jgi:hypothetical protein